MLEETNQDCILPPRLRKDNPKVSGNHGTACTKDKEKLDDFGFRLLLTIKNVHLLEGTKLSSCKALRGRGEEIETAFSNSKKPSYLTFVKTSHTSPPHQTHPPPGTLPGCAPQFAFSSLFSVTNFSFWTPSLLLICFWKPFHSTFLFFLISISASLHSWHQFLRPQPDPEVWSGAGSG